LRNPKKLRRAPYPLPHIVRRSQETERLLQKIIKNYAVSQGRWAFFGLDFCAIQ